MGFHFNPLKGITRAIGIPDKARLIFNAYNTSDPRNIGRTVALVGGAAKLFAGAFGGRSAQAPASSTTIDINQPAQTGGYTYGGGWYDDPYAQQSTYGYQPYHDSYGGDPWGSSMMYSTPSIQPYRVSSVQAAPQGRTWEDLTSLAGAVIPFFL